MSIDTKIGDAYYTGFAAQDASLDTRAWLSRNRMLTVRMEVVFSLTHGRIAHHHDLS